MSTPTSLDQFVAAPAILWPIDLERHLSISTPTRWRWERAGKLPPRDAYINGEPVGWLRSTIDAMLNGERHRAA
jgi:predicted DNA-binding transcriptional regulator AlpA